MTLQRSALHPLAAACGATFDERHGWELPLVYSGMAAEYLAATTAVAMHDASYVGRLKAIGADGLDLLNRLSTNKVLDLEPDQGAPTILTTDRGRILDLIGVVNVGDYVLLVTSPGTQQQVIEWLDKYTIMEDLSVEDITADTTMLSVLGPSSLVALEEAAASPTLGELLPYHSLLCEVGGHQVRIIHHPLGELSRFDLLFAPEAASDIWQHLLASGITPVGVEAFDAVRVAYAVPALGQEMGDSYNPLEAGLIGSIDFTKGCYIGQEVIARLDTYQKVQKHLVRLQFSPEASVSEGASLVHNGQSVGSVTSVTTIPIDRGIIGLGYVRKASAAVGVRLELAEPAAGWAEILGLPQLFGPGE